MIALAWPTHAQAQFVFGPALSTRYGARLGYGGGLGFSYHHRGLRVAGFAGGDHCALFSPRRLSPTGRCFHRSRCSHRLAGRPGSCRRGWGVGPGWGGLFLPPVIVVPPPIILAGGNVEDRKGRRGGTRAGLRASSPADRSPASRCAAGAVHRHQTPDSRGQARPDRATRRSRRLGAATVRMEIRFDPFAKVVKTAVEPREADPAKEAATRALGRAAFAAGEYGQAAEEFERAGVANPKLRQPTSCGPRPPSRPVATPTPRPRSARASISIRPGPPPRRSEGALRRVAAAFADHLATCARPWQRIPTNQRSNSCSATNSGSWVRRPRRGSGSTWRRSGSRMPGVVGLFK